jgi:hypothetical protein
MSEVLREIIDIVISRDTTPITRAGFGTPLIIGESDGLGVARVKTYSGIEGVAEDFDVTDDEYIAALAIFSQEEVPSRIKIGRKEYEETWTEAIQEVRDVDDDWYCLITSTRVEADILEIAGVVEALSPAKIYLAASDDATILDGQDDQDVGSLLQALDYDRSALFYHSNAANTFPEAAWAGKMLPKDPGSATWKFKRLTGVTADTFTATQRDALYAKNVNFYQQMAGVAVTFNGRMVGGEFIDVIRGVDWLEQRIAEDIGQLMISVDKIPFTNHGISQIEAVIRGRLEDAVGQSVLTNDPQYIVTVPKRDEVSFDDRANRRLTGITFEATLSGAVHRVRIRGSVTV